MWICQVRMQNGNQSEASNKKAMTKSWQVKIGQDMLWRPIKVWTRQSKEAQETYKPIQERRAKEEED